MKKNFIFIILIGILFITSLFFGYLYLKEGEKNSVLLSKIELDKGRIIDYQRKNQKLTNFRNNPDIPRLDFGGEVNQKKIDSFIQEIRYRFVIEGIEEADMQSVLNILQSIGSYEEIDLRFESIISRENLKPIWDDISKKKSGDFIKHISITLPSTNTNLHTGIIQDVVLIKGAETFNFYNVFINGELLEIIEKLEIFGLHIEGIYDSEIDDREVTRLMNNSGISEFSINNLILQSSGVSNGNGEIVLPKIPE